MKTFNWSLRRELWENRYIYLAPLTAAGIFIIGFLVMLIGGVAKIQSAFALAPAARHAALIDPYIFAALVILATGMGVALFYCLEALYSERRDKSVLFWKSLPVSDTTTVLAKATIPLVIMPLVVAILTIATQLAMLLMSSVALTLSGSNVGLLWQEVSPLRMALMVFYHAFTAHAIWYAPFFGWLLLLSAWAPQAVILWAGVPLVAIAVLEHLVLGSSRFVSMLQSRSLGGPEAPLGSMTMPIDPLTHIHPATFFASPGMWAGLAMAAVFLVGAVRVRRYRAPS